MIFYKLKPIFIHSNISTSFVSKFKKVFPEISKLSDEELIERLDALKVDFYTEEEKEIPLLIRLTLPFVFLVWLFLLLSLPLKFMATGKWGYKPNNILINWFKSLGL